MPRAQNKTPSYKQLITANKAQAATIAELKATVAGSIQLRIDSDKQSKHIDRLESDNRQLVKIASDLLLMQNLSGH